MQYATAYGALIEIAGLKAGDTLLIPAASSSVGIVAIQIARLVGATPVALTRSSSKRKPRALESNQGPIEVADLFLEDGTVARAVRFAAFSFLDE